MSLNFLSVEMTGNSAVISSRRLRMKAISSNNTVPDHDRAVAMFGAMTLVREYEVEL